MGENEGAHHPGGGEGNGECLVFQPNVTLRKTGLMELNLLKIYLYGSGRLLSASTASVQNVFSYFTDVLHVIFLMFY